VLLRSPLIGAHYVVVEGYGGKNGFFTLDVN
jgi:hypothetical protein